MKMNKDQCLTEARNVTDSTAMLANLLIDQSNGLNVDDQIIHEMDNLTENNLMLKKCILESM
jgi:hypothetical protein